MNVFTQMVVRYYDVILLGAVLFPLLIWIVLWIVHRRSPFSMSTSTVLALSILSLLLMRLPTFFLPYPFNEDEAVFLARARTILEDPYWFRSIDGTTSGPLNHYPLTLLLMLGLPYSYLTCRVLAFLLLALSNISLYFGVKKLSDDDTARWALVTATLFWGAMVKAYFIAYSSELVSVALLMMAFGMFSVTNSKGRTSKLYLSIEAMLLGAVPFAKLQVTALAFPLALARVFSFFHKKTWWNIPGYSLSFLSPSLLVFGVVWKFGYLNDFWSSYVESTMVLREVRSSAWQGGFFERLGATLYYMFCVPEWSILILMLLMLLAHISVRPAQSFSLLKDSNRLLLVIGALSSFLSIATIVVSGAMFPHYLIIAIYPLLLFMSWMVEWIRVHGRVSFLQISLLTWELVLISFIALFCITYLPYALQRADRPTVALGSFHRVTEFVQSRVPVEGEPLALWGWGARFYVELGAYQATRDTVTFYQTDGLIPSKLTKRYITRYIDDLRRSKPKVLIDSSKYTQLPYFFRVPPISDFPDVAMYVNEEYSLLASIEGVDVYLRKGLREPPY